MRPVNASSPRAARRRAFLLGALLALALPWNLLAQATGQPPAEPAPTAPGVPTPGTADRPVATAPPSASQPIAPPPAAGLVTPPDGKAPPAAPDSRYIARPVVFASPPKLDGRLDEPVWKTATRLDGFRQLEPHEGEPASQQTEVFLGFDNDSLYIGVRCHDSNAKKEVATILTRDGDLTYDDEVQILLDTYHDGRNGFLFATNPLGAQVDALVRNEGEEVNLDWDGIWSVETTRDSDGWTLEMAIPWRTLRFPSRPEQEWGINVERYMAANQERSFWKPVQHSWYARYKLSDAGTLVGLEGARPGSRFHFSPYVILGAERPTDGSTSGVTHAGGDVKINIASNLVADLTYKTDFSEAEADEQDVNLSRNALLFPEKRAFFLEGQNLFYFGERPDPEHPAETFLFFSRQIGLTPDGRATIPILGGVKLTGHEAGYDVGVLSLQTEATREHDGYGGLVDEPQATYSVARLKRSFGSGSTFGIIGLSKDATGDRNRVGGADWDIAFNPNLRTGGYVAKSSTPGVTAPDWAGSADLYWDSRRARLHYQYTDIGQGFNDELGYISRTGVRAFRTDNYWILWPERGPFKQAWFVYDLDYITDRTTRQLQTRINHLKFSAYFRDSSGLAYKFYDELEVLTTPFEIKRGLFIPAGSYRFGHHFVGYQSDYTKPFGVAGRLAWGDYYDGDFLQAFGFFAYRPLPGLFIAATYQRTQVRLKEGSFNSDIALAEVTYAFTPRLSTRTWLQWDRDTNLRAKVDVAWEFRPGSKLFVVYQDIRTYIDFFDRRQPLFGTPGRSLLAKVVFLF